MVQCSACGKFEAELGGGLLMMRCARCCIASYCNGECQRAHLKAHRAACKQRATEIAANVNHGLVGVEGLNSAAALRRAADAGDAGALMRLGLCYKFGKGGVGEDAAEAARKFTLAVEARNPPAEAYYNLAVCYNFGIGLQKYIPEASRLFRISAEMGHPIAQHNLGVCLMRGKGVHYDPVEAFTWFKRAADAGHADAQCKVGYALQTGLGVPEDKAAGVVYYRRAAEQGDAIAMCSLEVCYLTGDGVPQNVPQSVAWLTRARDVGHPGAATRLAEITPLLTLEERAEVDQLLATPLPRPSALTASFGGAGGAGGAGAPPPPAPTS